MPGETVDPIALTFIQRCLESRWEPAALDRAASLTAKAGFDWPDVLQVSYRTRTTALLHDALQDRGWVPDEVKRRLHQVYLQAAFRHLRSVHEYGQLLQALNEAGIDLIVFKGPVLTELVYRNPALRSYTDLDILVHRNDVRRTQAVLSELGYTRKLGELRPGAREDFGSEDAWGKEVGPLNLHIDLHWKPVGKIYGEMAWIWDYTQLWEIQGVPTRVFRPEVRLLYLAAHLALHHGQFASHDMLYMLYDIALLIRTAASPLDWQLVLELARTHRLALPLRIVLHKVEASWPLDLSLNVKADLEEIQASRADAQALSLYTTEVDSRIDRLSGFWISLGTYASWQERLATIKSHVFPSWTYMTQRYQTKGPIHTALSYPYRWGYSLISLARTLSRLLVQRR